MKISKLIGYFRSKSLFAIVELLIVVGIVSVLSATLLITINPAELIKQGRDSARASNLAMIESAIGSYQEDTPLGFLGNASTTYVSIPDPTATSTVLGNQCTGLGLPVLPPGWTYHCSASSTYRNIDGTGWIPVNFAGISYGPPFAALPIDPVNNASSGEYYIYNGGDGFETTAIFESQKYIPTMASDGGIDLAVFEKGSNSSLAIPAQRGLVGYWKFDDEEDDETTARDSSGCGNNAKMYSSSTPENFRSSSGCKHGSCANFNSSRYNYALTSSASCKPTGNTTIIAWIKTSGDIFVTGLRGAAHCSGRGSLYTEAGKAKGSIYLGPGNPEDLYTVEGNTTVNTGEWQQIAFVRDGSSIFVYLNGNLQETSNATAQLIASSDDVYTFGADRVTVAFPCGGYSNGLLDDVRVYNKALSQSEIRTLYQATK